MPWKDFAARFVVLLAMQSSAGAAEPEKFTIEPGRIYDAATLATHIGGDLSAISRIHNPAERDLAWEDFKRRYSRKEVSVKGPIWKIYGKVPSTTSWPGGYLVLIGTVPSKDGSRETKMDSLMGVVIGDKQVVAKLKPTDTIVVRGDLYPTGFSQPRLLRVTILPGE